MEMGMKPAIILAAAVLFAVLIPTFALSRCELTNSDLPQTNSRGQDFGDKNHR